MLDALTRDVRFAIRRLTRVPGLSLIIIVTIALGVGANAALFSVMNAVVLRPLPYPSAHRLVLGTLVDAHNFRSSVPLATLAEIHRGQQGLDALFGYSAGGLLVSEVDGALLQTPLEAVDPRMYDVLGVQPYVGRLISADDAPTSGIPAPVVVLGYGFWQRAFGGDPHAVGRVLRVEGTPLTIIGVTPPSYVGFQVEVPNDIAVSVPLLARLLNTPAGRPMRANYMVGRLRPGATLAATQAELAARWPAIRDATVPPGYRASEQASYRTLDIRLISLETGMSHLRDLYTRPLSLLVALAGLLLFIACANLAGLLLARQTSRQPEFAVCLALGASRGRLVQHMVTESLVLSVVGTAAAVPLAWWTSRALGAMLWTGVVPMRLALTPDARVIGAMGVLAIAVGLVIGLLPAWIASRRARLGLQPVRAASARIGWTGRALLTGQVGLSLVLLVGAGLFARSLANLRAIDLGFQPTRLLVGRVDTQPGASHTLEFSQYLPDLVRHLEAVPGVTSAAVAHLFPAPVTFPHVVAPSGATDRTMEVTAAMDSVSPGFFRTVRIALDRGRDFAWQDMAGTPAVAIISQGLAARLFPSSNPIGQHIRIGDEPDHRAIEVVGIVGDARLGDIRLSAPAAVYRPILQEPTYQAIPMLEIRTASDPGAVAGAVRNTVQSLGRHFAPSLWRADEEIDRYLLQERVTALLASGFASLAIVLAYVGVFGVLAHSVARRTRELGIHIALGATREAVRWMVLRDGLTVSLLGVAVGAPLAIAGARLVRAFLYGASPFDATTLALAAAVFLAVGGVASLLPAWRAARVNPLDALRAE